MTNRIDEIEAELKALSDEWDRIYDMATAAGTAAGSNARKPFDTELEANRKRHKKLQQELERLTKFGPVTMADFERLEAKIDQLLAQRRAE